MRLLLINPNTTPAVTDLVAQSARAVAGTGVAITAATGRFGARYISNRAAYAIAGHAALEALAEHVAGHDAVCLACFGDPGLSALQELSPVPVVGMAAAACREAASGGRRFGIVTGGRLWEPMLTEFVAWLGLSAQLAGVRAVAPTGGEIARDPDAALAILGRACREAVEADGAEVVILGGAALAGLAGRLQPDVPAPLICSVETAIRATVAAAGSGEAFSGNGLPTDSIGLSGSLEAALAAGGAR